MQPHSSMSNQCTLTSQVCGSIPQQPEHSTFTETTLIARFRGRTWGPSGANRTQVGPMLVPWTLLSGQVWCLDDVDLLSRIFRKHSKHDLEHEHIYMCNGHGLYAYNGYALFDISCQISITLFYLIRTKLFIHSFSIRLVSIDLRMVSANERTCHICNAFSHWLRRLHIWNIFSHWLRPFSHDLRLWIDSGPWCLLVNSYLFMYPFSIQTITIMI